MFRIGVADPNVCTEGGVVVVWGEEGGGVGGGWAWTGGRRGFGGGGGGGLIKTDWQQVLCCRHVTCSAAQWHVTITNHNITVDGLVTVTPSAFAQSPSYMQEGVSWCKPIYHQDAYQLLMR